MELSVSSAMQSRLREYTGYHRALGNEACHFIGIPSIIVGAATLLGAVRLVTLGSFTLSLAEIVAAAILVFYVVSARVLGAITGLILFALVALGRALPFWWGFGLFVLGWIVQFVGHAVWEKRSPAFLRNLVHLLVGPAWLVERALSRL
ncbi:MAG TPA: Mpo1-like protein [Polyangiaceae bacterium]